MPHHQVALVIDDDPSLSELFTLALTQAGFDVEAVQDSTTAMARIRARQPDLITLDMQMPRVSGMEVLAQVRADPALAHIKVMVISASSQSVVEGAFDQADIVLMKPIALVQVMQIAQRLVQGSEA